jgi:hypothetical protein
MFSLQQNRRTRGQNMYFPEAGGWGQEEAEGKLAKTMYTHVNKCKNEKRKKSNQIFPVCLIAHKNDELLPRKS